MGFYQKAHEKETKERLNESNMLAWMNGVYVSRAVSSCFNRQAEYPTSPIDFFSDNVDESPAETFRMMAQQFNERFRKKMASVGM